MYTNIGRKIMILAKCLCWIGIALTILFCLFIPLNGTSNISVNGVGIAYTPTSHSSSASVLGVVVVLVVGCLGSWFSSMVLYGFGKLIDDNAAMRKLMEASARRDSAE